MYGEDTEMVTSVDDASSTAGESQVDVNVSETEGQGGAEVSPEGTDANDPSSQAESVEARMARLEDRLNRTARGYDDQRSMNAQVLNENRRLTEELKGLKAQLQTNKDADLLNQDTWVDRWSDPKEAVNIVDRRAEAIAQRVIEERMASMTAEQQQRAEQALEVVARQEVAGFAKKLRLSEDEFREVHERNPFLNNLPSREYQRAAVAVMKGEYADRLAKVIPAAAARAGSEAAAQRLSNAGVNKATPVQAGRSELTPSQEFMAMLREHEKQSG